MILQLVCLVSLVPMLVRGVSYSCPSEQVLALVSATPNEIDMNSVPVTVCNEKRTCVYTQGAPCASKGQYASGVSEVNGKVIHGCCQITPAVKDHQSDECHSIVIETTDSLRVSSPPRPPPFTKGQRPPSGGNGGGPPPPPPKESVVMELKNLPPGMPNQYIKSITKLSGSVQGYTVTVCTPQCGRSTTTTTTKRPTPSTQRQAPTTQKQNSEEKQESQELQQQQQQMPTAPPGKKHGKKGLLGGGHACFSSDMTVTTPTGTKRMDQIRAGDQVLVMSSGSQPVFEPVEWLYHRDPNAEADFLTITTKSQRVLRLSGNHLIPFVPCSNDDLKSMGPDHFANSQSFFARRLRVGNCVATMMGNEFVSDQVISITKERKRGIYSPITNQGTIVVNHVFASCYSSVENHLAQRTVHSVLINARHMISRVWSSFFDTPLAQEDADVPVPLKVLLKMAELVVPSNVFTGK